MYSLNKVQIIGNLTRDPEIRTTPQGTSVASFSVATNFTYTDASGQKVEKPEFHNVVAWRKLAEIIGQYVKKGSKIYVEGRLQTRDWTDQTGVKKYRTEIVADNMIMLDSKGGNGGSFRSQTSAADELPTIETPVSAPAKDEINLDEIPF